jgi:hypothetical protein
METLRRCTVTPAVAASAALLEPSDVFLADHQANAHCDPHAAHGKGSSMNRLAAAATIVSVLAFLSPAAAPAQTTGAAPAAATPAPAKAAAPAVVAPPAAAAATPVVGAAPTPAVKKRAPRTRHRAPSNADARVCLEFPTNLQVIACAEKYRSGRTPSAGS